MDDTVQTVMTQCELWTDTSDMGQYEHKTFRYSSCPEPKMSMVADKTVPYWKEKLIYRGIIWMHVKVIFMRF